MCQCLSIWFSSRFILSSYVSVCKKLHLCVGREGVEWIKIFFNLTVYYTYRSHKLIWRKLRANILAAVFLFHPSIFSFSGLATLAYFPGDSNFRCVVRKRRYSLVFFIYLFSRTCFFKEIGRDDLRDDSVIWSRGKKRKMQMAMRDTEPRE